MQSFLTSLQTAAPVQDRAHNSLNGGDAESYAMAKMILACRGEGQWGSRAEDGCKIDLIFSSQHPWHKGERILILAQVKSGESYGRLIPDGFVLSGRAKAEAKRTSHGICVIWVDRDTSKLFWAYVHPKTKATQQCYGALHEVSPATIYDLARCMAAQTATKSGAKGLVVRKRTGNITERRKRVKQAYRAGSGAQSPVIGRVEFTKYGWRHIFRRGRLKANKSASMDLIPYLKKLLQRFPTKHAINASELCTKGQYQYRTCEHLLKYDGVSIFDKQIGASRKAVAHVRLVEEIKFPELWDATVMLSQSVMRRVVLKSAYYKIEG